VDFDGSAIEGNVVDLNVDGVVGLQGAEDPIEDAFLRPSVSTGINGVPVAELLW
jgi:hypothetical protein